MFSQYLENIFKTHQAGAREESYYPDLKKLLEAWSEKENLGLVITALPKKTEGGNPDFRILSKDKKLIGYIEAKDIFTDLDRIEDTVQLKRYRATFPNLILTNFFEFRLYRQTEADKPATLINKTFIGRQFLIQQLNTVPPLENTDKFQSLLKRFIDYSTPRTLTAKQLAIELAKKTRFLRDQIISEEHKEEAIEGVQTLEAFYAAFKKHLISALTLQDFANLFAQTITYGLFAARSRASGDFTRHTAFDHIPHTIGILRDVFRFISSSELTKTVEWIVDEIVEVLAATDVNKIIEGFHKEGRGRDPIVHFYETFLSEYDPAERGKRGVYYTPEPVVGYIVRSINKLLKEKFNKTDGFATDNVTILDPASGTLTFPVEAIRLAVEEYRNKYGDGGIKSFIRDHILKDFFAFELMMAPYAIGHLKAGFILKENDYDLSDQERFNLYLTNTLEFNREDPNTLGFIEREIAQEAQDALKVKEDIPVMVIMGNPPYSGTSENKGDWILEQLAAYKQVDGAPLGEKNPKWLQDDYVKFFRFAQWKIEQTGRGILGFITNHAWLDNPTFRGMRASLLGTFDEIYILNLHGSLLKKEKTPNGGKDENVFDIQPGVAIVLMVKK
ncbi:MAG: N-6 DNA methylase [Patescibacteria group bacterium]